jgi:hypothetical protein
MHGVRNFYRSVQCSPRTERGRSLCGVPRSLCGVPRSQCGFAALTMCGVAALTVASGGIDRTRLSHVAWRRKSSEKKVFSF